MIIKRNIKYNKITFIMNAHKIEKSRPKLLSKKLIVLFKNVYQLF